MIDYAQAFASLGTTVASALGDAIPVVVPIFGALVGLSVFIGVLGKFGLRK